MPGCLARSVPYPKYGTCHNSEWYMNRIGVTFIYSYIKNYCFISKYYFIYPDKDECKLWGYCDQLCENKVDNYTCLCDDDYRRIESEKKCKVKATHPKMMLYFAYHDKVLKVIIILFVMLIYYR